MKLPSLVRFLQAEDAAVTVDWVVLTAALVGLGLTTAASVRQGSGALAGEIAASLSSASVALLGDVGSTGEEGCDWVCAYTAFLWAEEPGFTEEEFGGTVEEMAQMRLDEFNSYSTQMLLDHVASIAPHYQNQPEPYRTYYAAEITAIEEIIAAREAGG